MVSYMDRARKAARKVQERLYDGLATVTEYQKIRDKESGLTSHKEVVVLENQPCRLSFKTISEVKQSEAAATAQVIKLFLSPDVTIRPGSKVEVTQAGVTAAYQCSGTPAVYFTHQEIILTLFDKWA